MSGIAEIRALGISAFVSHFSLESESHEEPEHDSQNPASEGTTLTPASPSTTNPSSNLQTSDINPAISATTDTRISPSASKIQRFIDAIWAIISYPFRWIADLAYLIARRQWEDFRTNYLNELKCRTQAERDRPLCLETIKKIHDLSIIYQDQLSQLLQIDLPKKEHPKEVPLPEELLPLTIGIKHLAKLNQKRKKIENDIIDLRQIILTQPEQYDSRCETLLKEAVTEAENLIKEFNAL